MVLRHLMQRSHQYLPSSMAILVSSSASMPMKASSICLMSPKYCLISLFFGIACLSVASHEASTYCFPYAELLIPLRLSSTLSALISLEAESRPACPRGESRSRGHRNGLRGIKSRPGINKVVFPPSQDLRVDHVSDLLRKLGPSLFSHIVDLDCSLRESIFMTVLLTTESSTKQKVLSGSRPFDNTCDRTKMLQESKGYVYVLMIYRSREGIRHYKSAKHESSWPPAML